MIIDNIFNKKLKKLLYINVINAKLSIGLTTKPFWYFRT